MKQKNDLELEEDKVKNNENYNEEEKNKEGKTVQNKKISNKINKLIETIEKSENTEEIVDKLKKYLKKIDTESKKDCNYTSVKISFWRILAYFIIYSFLGFMIETLFALFNYGVFESRQSFLYGPFCCIYGLGAVIIILVLNYKFFKNNHTLFIGGFIVGSIVEYFVSLLGELILNVKWWDYSNRFLNINGRICFLYSIFWGLLGVYLMRVINPFVDKYIDWFKEKVNLILLKIMTLALIVFLFFDCLISAYAINVFLIKVAVENDVQINYKQETEKIYDELYKDEEKAEFLNKFFSVEKMLMTYPNLTITLQDGSMKKISEFYPDVKNYYYKFDTQRNI